MKNIKTISVCCSAEVRVCGGTYDFIGESAGCTMYYVCMKCNEPCDIKEDKSHGKKKI